MIQAPKDPGAQPPKDSGPSPVILLVVGLAVVVGGYLLAGKLREMSRLEDCLMSGRTNCAPIDTPR